MTIEFIDEFRIDEKTKGEIAHLLAVCFPENNNYGRTYYKQLPHYRLLLRMNDKVVAQLALDYRVMALNKIPVRVLGIIDLVVLPELQGQGLGKNLLTELIRIADSQRNNIDFLYLVTDKPGFYEKCGFVQTKLNVKWLALHQHANYGLREEKIEDSILMYKKVGQMDWQDGELEMLGYLY